MLLKRHEIKSWKTEVLRNIYPLPYAIPDKYVVSEVSRDKKVNVAISNPGKRKDYLFGHDKESEYHDSYRSAYFGITRRKGGWDALRHYEILANGCVPLFEDLDSCPLLTCTTLPKPLLAESNFKYGRSKQPDDAYFTLARKLLEYTRANLTTTALAEYFLSHFDVKNPKVLLLTCHPGENYTRELLSIGLRTKLGSNFVDVPRIEVLYEGFDREKTYGFGFTYGGQLENIRLSREDIAKRILSREFDIVIYGKIGIDELEVGSIPNVPYWSEVKRSCPWNRIVFLYGGDHAQNLTLRDEYSSHLATHAQYGLCFVRELIA